MDLQWNCSLLNMEQGYPSATGDKPICWQIFSLMKTSNTQFKIYKNIKTTFPCDKHNGQECERRNKNNPRH